MSNRCEDFPCCGHGPPPLGDDGGCPDEEGRFDCVLCHNKMPLNHTSAICNACRNHRHLDDEEMERWQDRNEEMDR